MPVATWQWISVFISSPGLACNVPLPPLRVEFWVLASTALESKVFFKPIDDEMWSRHPDKDKKNIEPIQLIGLQDSRGNTHRDAGGRWKAPSSLTPILFG
jgi:hypothetical protein